MIIYWEHVGFESGVFASNAMQFATSKLHYQNGEYVQV